MVRHGCGGGVGLVETGHEAKLPADRIFAREEAVGHQLIDDDVRRAGRAVGHLDARGRA